MKKYVLLLFAALLLGVSETSAQLNKAYFFYMGREFLMDNRYKDAIEILNVLLKADSNAYEGYFLRGVAKYNLDDLLGAENDFSRAIAKNPVFTMAHQYRAITNSRLGNYDDALHDFQEAIDLRPDVAGSYYSRGVTYLLSKQMEKAIDDFDRFIRYEPRVADAYINRGTCYLLLKDTSRAYDNYNMAIRTNRLNPEGYNRRGGLLLAQEKYAEALEDFNTAIEADSSYLLSYFNRAIVHANTKKPLDAIRNFDYVIRLDSANSLAYFNRAILRSQIGDYNNALEDYNQVARFNPNNVLVFYNRGNLQTQLGDYRSAVKDFGRAIELYPDFANAYLNRANLRYLLHDVKGAKSDQKIAEAKIAEYRAKLTDSTFSVYADTSKHFNQLLAFDSDFGKRESSELANSQKADITLLPLFKFSLDRPDTTARMNYHSYYHPTLAEFLETTQNPYLTLTNKETLLPSDSLIAIDKHNTSYQQTHPGTWKSYFERAISQSLIRQYTNSINSYARAIELDPRNPFLYLNRSTTQSEMIDFISSIDNNYQKIIIDSDPVNKLHNNSTRVYNYDDALKDLDKAAGLFPDFAYIYYNRGNLKCLSGDMPGAIEDYTQAIALYPYFAEAYYNRGLVQIYLQDTKKGCLDISKAGELGINQAYKVLKKYTKTN